MGGQVPVPHLSPGARVTHWHRGGPNFLPELSHPLSSPFCGGSFLQALQVGGHRQACALARLWGWSPACLAPCRPSGFSLPFSRCRGLCWGSTTPLLPTPRHHLPPDAWGLPALALTGDKG